MHMKSMMREFSILAFVVLLSVCSYYYLDKQIALFVNNALLSDERLCFLSSDIPDVLFSAVCLITVAAWIAYFYLTKRGVYNIHTRFFFIVACTMPITYLLKFVLKHAVGRIDTRFWLIHPSLKEFHWLHGGGHFTSFPSGHMAVSAALAVALWDYYPQYRLAYIVFLIVEALALLMTDYHFLSDIMAGTYLGIVAYLGTLYVIKKSGKMRERNGKRFE